MCDNIAFNDCREDIPTFVPAVDRLTHNPKDYIPKEDIPSIQGGLLTVIEEEEEDEEKQIGTIPEGERYAYGYWSPPKYPTFKSPKRKRNPNPKRKPSRKLVKKKLWQEEPPVVNENGEQSEVQVLTAYNPDDILKDMFPEPICPRCHVTLQYGCIKNQDGSILYEYYRCPETKHMTKCYVTCSKHDVQDYLDKVVEQTHPIYNTIPLARFRCFCNKSLVLTISNSQKNPGRLYLKCQKRNCNFFQWINETPRGISGSLII